MKENVLREVRTALAAGVRRLSGVDTAAELFHLPAKCAPASVYLPERAREPRLYAYLGDAFDDVLGVRLVGRASLDRTFLMLYFTEEFYDALVAYMRASLPTAADDCGRLALNRMIALSRKGGEGCPPDAVSQALLWQLVCLLERPGGAREAERAATAYLTHLAPRERMALANRCGALADAAARILYQFGKD